MPEPAPVLVTAVNDHAFGGFQFVFDTQIDGHDAVPDPAFEVWSPVNGWASPIIFYSKVPYAIRYGWNAGWDDATLWRINTLPDHVWWDNAMLSIPQNGVINR